MQVIRSILVANRGEIAVRVMVTAKSLGYRTIAVYSRADADAPHVHMADDAVLLGPAAVTESYLDPERILRAAVATDTAGLEAFEGGVRKQVRKCAPGANAATKEILLATRRLDQDSMVDFAAGKFARCMLAEEGREGIAAFVEKRKPAWAETVTGSAACK